MSVERKFFDINPTGVTTAVTYPGTAANTAWAAGIASFGDTAWIGGWISDVPLGTGGAQRTGNAISVDSLFMRFTIIPDTAEPAGSLSRLRIIIATDEECDGAGPGIQEIIGTGPTAVTTIATGLIMVGLQPGYWGRFKILEDKFISWSTANEGWYPDAGERIFHHEIFKDLKEHMIRWDPTNAGGSNIANARRGHIFVFLLHETIVQVNGAPTLSSTAGAPLTLGPQVLQYSRIRYKDADS